MKYQYNTNEHFRAVAVIERSAGNDQVGDMWLETHTYPLTATLQEVFDWAATRCSGRLMLTLDQAPQETVD